MKRSDISDLQALSACWPWGGAQGPQVGPVTALRAQGYPEKVALRKLEQLDDRGWIEYGVSIYYAWRTPEGEAELDRLVEELREATRKALGEGE